jgi:CRISPR-associated endonuclease/helicase Cas3
MNDFESAFLRLTGNPPFLWQRDLYAHWFSQGQFPDACTLPTGLGKTSVIAVWLIALANGKPVPRRLVYVVNRRTVVDQTTAEAEKYRANAEAAGVPIPAISTLRGQFADNRAWSADPSKPAIIAGTVDMIGSRLLFSGYGVGFKLKPLHAGFLGQDVLLVHDEAHLEKPFQDLVEAIAYEQAHGRTSDFLPMKVMALTATPRGGEKTFELTQAEKAPPKLVPEDDEPLHVAWCRLRAKKKLTIVSAADEKQVVPAIVELAHQRRQEFPDSRIIVFVRTVDAVTEVRNGLRSKKIPAENISALTGTMRGLERNRQADPREKLGDPVFARFLKPPKSPEEPWKVEPRSGTVYLICTAAGEVGVDISADHLVCDLTPFDSMAQRFGRVNRYGAGNACIDLVHEAKANDKKKDDPYDKRRWLTLAQLVALNGDASPYAIEQLPLANRVAAFTPTPIVLPTSDILFDTWTLTTIRDKLPGRPKVEAYLHGLAEWEPPETHVAWRNEVGFITEDLLRQFDAEELLDDYPLKPHELLRDNSGRVHEWLKKLSARPETPVWVIADDDSVESTSLGALIDARKETIEGKTILLPPTAGGLSGGMLGSSSDSADDVADEWFDEQGRRRRMRVWDDDPVPEDMQLIRTIDTKPDADEAEADEVQPKRFWHWFERRQAGDTDGSKANSRPLLWDMHVADVVKNATGIVSRLTLPDGIKGAIIFAARFHDHGKRRKQFQVVLNNFKYPDLILAKSGKHGGRIPEMYRHEFGSLVDLERDTEFKAIADEDQKDLIRHLIAVHHGYSRPHFPADRAFDPEHGDTAAIAAEVPRRFARLQRKYGRWGLAYLESLLRAADYAASANPSPEGFVEDEG